MKFTIQREAILKPLQMVAGVVEKRQTMPILSNLLMTVGQKKLSLLATDLEIELKSFVEVDEAGGRDKEITIPARKLMDICRTLPEESSLSFSLEDQKVLIRSGRSRFSLATLPATEFPNTTYEAGIAEFSMKSADLQYLIANTQFAMAQQDVRYYLNGMLLSIEKGLLRSVATDGHRLALSATEHGIEIAPTQIIIPRKAITELSRLLGNSGEEIKVIVGSHFVRVLASDFTFTSKLIDGRFPDYNKVLPKGGDKIITVERELLKQALVRVGILSSDKVRGVRLQLRPGVLKVTVNNPEQEEAEEELAIDYKGPDFDIGFNVNYLIDALNTARTEQIKLTLSDANSSVLLEETPASQNRLVVMPLRL